MPFIPDGQINRIGFKPDKKSFGGFIDNVGQSSYTALSDLMGAVVNTVNPNMEKNTIANLGKLAIGAGQLLIPGEQGFEGNARAVGSFYKDRYGGLDNIANTLYNDPIGVGLDVATVATGVGGALKGAGTASKIAGLTKAGNAFTKAGGFADPFALAGKGARAASRPITKAIRPAAKDVSKFLARRSIKATGSQANKFKDANNGMPVEEFMLKNNIDAGATQAGLKQLHVGMDPLQKSYDKLTKTGSAIDRKVYAQALLDKAIELEKSADDPATRQLVEQLFKEAQYQNSKLSALTDNQLVQTKTKAFKNSSDNALANPYVSSYQEQIGRAGQSAIESIAPGSKELGQKLKPYYALQDIMAAQSEVGRGAQIINGFKAPMAGLLAGAGAGSFLPGVGNLGGAVAGSVGAYVANSPRFQGKAAVALNKLSRGKVPKIPGKIVNAGQSGYDFARYGRVANPIHSDSPTTRQQATRQPSIPQTQSMIKRPSQPPTPKLQPYQMPMQTKSPQAFGGNVRVQRGSFY